MGRLNLNWHGVDSVVSKCCEVCYLSVFLDASITYTLPPPPPLPLPPEGCCNDFSVYLQGGQITPDLALKVLLEFDKAINASLATRVKNKVNFKVSYHYYFNSQNISTPLPHALDD